MTNEAKMASNPASPELTDDGMALVVGGDKVAEAQQIAENKKQADALKGFQQALQELP